MPTYYPTERKYADTNTENKRNNPKPKQVQTGSLAGYCPPTSLQYSYDRFFINTVNKICLTRSNKHTLASLKHKILQIYVKVKSCLVSYGAYSSRDFSVRSLQILPTAENTNLLISVDQLVGKDHNTILTIYIRI